MNPGHAIIQERRQTKTRLAELEQELAAIEAVLRASGCKGGSALELATYAAENLTTDTPPKGLTGLAEREAI